MVQNGNWRTSYDTNLSVPSGLKAKKYVTTWTLYGSKTGHFILESTLCFLPEKNFFWVTI